MGFRVKVLGEAIGARTRGRVAALAAAALIMALTGVSGAAPALALRPAQRAFLPFMASTASLEGEEAAMRETETEEASQRILPPSRAHGATIAGIAVGVEARAKPGAGRGIWWVSTATSWSGEPQVLLVLGSTVRHGEQWLRVLLPLRPDSTSGWIPRQDAVLMSTSYWVRVNKPARRVSIYSRGRLLHSYRSVIGKPATPTPDGLAAIYEIDPQPSPSGFLGPWAMPLTALSGVLHSFEGGPGRVAIHGRDGASLQDPLGSALSHGCIRIDNGPITWMAHHLPQGTPVQITG